MNEHSTRTLEREPQQPLAILIRVLNAPAEPAEFRLEAGVCRLGAGRDADLVVVDDTVSRLHAELTLAREGVEVRDLNSRNGTHYLGQRVQRIILAPGSRFRIGTTEVAVDADRQTLDRLAPAACVSYGSAIGVSQPMRKLFATLLRLESSLVNVLLQGESGTGKELLARAIHAYSSVSAAPFVVVNCGELDRALVRSELFGHRKGAFTGAIEHHMGAFESAAGGTLFLDEVGELPLDVQPALLRALESGKVVRVGEVSERSARVRLIAATNRELASEVERKTFRADLYYRLAVVTLRIPPLRERPDDVEALVRHFAELLGIGELPPALLTDLRRRTWSGNARELRNVLEAFAALGTFDVGAARAPGESEVENVLDRWIDAAGDYAAQKQALLEAFQRTYVRKLLALTAGNQSEAARISGLQRSYLGQLAAKARKSRKT